jgi:hypothetical protein
MEIRLAEYSTEKAGGGSSTPYLASIIQDFSANRVLSLLRTQSFEWPGLNGTIKTNRGNSQEFQRIGTRNMIDAS